MLKARNYFLTCQNSSKYWFILLHFALHDPVLLESLGICYLSVMLIFFILGIGMSHETLKAAGILFAGKGLWLAGGRAGPTVSYRTKWPTVMPNVKTRQK